MSVNQKQCHGVKILIKTHATAWLNSLFQVALINLSTRQFLKHCITLTFHFPHSSYTPHHLCCNSKQTRFPDVIKECQPEKCLPPPTPPDRWMFPAFFVVPSAFSDVNLGANFPMKYSQGLFTPSCESTWFTINHRLELRSWPLSLRDERLSSKPQLASWKHKVDWARFQRIQPSCFSIWVHRIPK